VKREGDKLLRVKRNGLTATAILLIAAVGQLYVTVGFASPAAGNNASAAPAQIMGVLTTRDNKPVTVNGAAAVSGASIPSGAEITTPDGVGATLRLGSLGTLCIAPGSQVTVEFAAGSIRVTITSGCAILSTKKGTTGTIITPQGTAGQTDPAGSGSIDVCSRPGAAAAVNQGAAADAGAGASALDCGAAGAAAAPPTGIPAPATVAMIAGGAGALYLLFRGGNPSPSGP
jgi:hypothetical protein